MRQRLLSIAIILSVIAISCKESTDKGDTDIDTAKINATSNLDSSSTQDLIQLVYNYFALKDALVASDANKADIAAKDCITNIGSIAKSISIDSTDQYTDLLLPLSNAEIALATFLDVEDESTEKKRVEFDIISDAVYNIIKTAKLKNLTIYRQYCPMAFNDLGAYWLSNNKEIRNPYFGNKMLECGEVTEVIK